jgi:hypothetical protein
MTTAASRLPPLFITACIFIGVGTVCLFGTLVLEPPSHISKGFLYISSAFILFGLGEVLNHPKERLNTHTPEENPTQTTEFQRRRNVCSLGNLCDICALLLFFIGISAMFFPI